MNLGIILILLSLFIILTTIEILLVIVDEKCDLIMKELGIVRKSYIERVKSK